MTSARNEVLPPALERAVSIQRYARMGGVLLLVSLVAGGFGEGFVPSKLIVSSSATVTAHNLQSFEALYRLGFAAYLIEAMCDVGLSLVFYVLLRRVDRYLALLSVFFALMGTATFAACELFYVAPTLILDGSGSLANFSTDQLNALALLSLRLFGYGGMMLTMFYGVASLLRGYLIFRSGYLPRFLGVLLGLGGLGFIARNFLLALAPGYAPEAILFLMFPAGLALIGWLLVKGVDVERWEAVGN